jgi:molecular chaperone Hsp33
MKTKSVDYLIRGTFKNLDARFALVCSTGVVDAGVKIHETEPVAAFVFGRALTVAALTIPLLEGREKYSLRWSYDGAIGSIVAEATASGDVRGIPGNSDLSGVDTEAALYGEKGVISIMKSADSKVLNSGQAPAGLLDIADDVAFFLSTSDQIETAMKSLLAFNADPENPVGLAVGFMLQALPGCDLKKFDVLREKMNDSKFNDILGSPTLAEENKLRHLTTFLTSSSEAMEFQFGATPRYHCSCGNEKMKMAVKTLRKKELNEIFAENGKPTVTCHFCRKKYAFTKEELDLD